MKEFARRAYARLVRSIAAAWIWASDACLSRGKRLQAHADAALERGIRHALLRALDALRGKLMRKRP